MGVLLRPTPEMGPWTVELFTDHACLRRSAPIEHATTAAAKAPSSCVRDDVMLPELEPAASPDRRLGFGIADVMPLIAARDQVLADGLYCDYINRNDADLSRWRQPRVEDDWVTIEGPVLDAATRVRDRSVEFRYTHVAELRLVLADFANALTADDTA